VRILACAGLLLFAALPAAANERKSVMVGATERHYEVHLPKGRAPAAHVPLVIVLHGGGGDAETARQQSGMDAKADQDGFIAVYPIGTTRRGRQVFTWNAWRCCGAALAQRVDDVGFIRVLVDTLAGEYRIDRKRIYATGHSNGGMLAYRLGCEAADVFAAIAPLSAALNTHECRAASPVSVIAFHGTADEHVLFEGGEPRRAFDLNKREDNSVAFAMDFWKKRDGCAAEPKRSRDGRVVHDAWTCAEGTAVELYATEGGGHVWPAGATDRIWEFFKRHPKR
jgi:polyhydroxybutyrate depolymerase